MILYYEIVAKMVVHEKQQNGYVKGRDSTVGRRAVSKATPFDSYTYSLVKNDELACTEGAGVSCTGT